LLAGPHNLDQLPDLKNQIKEEQKRRSSANLPSAQAQPAREFPDHIDPNEYHSFVDHQGQSKHNSSFHLDNNLSRELYSAVNDGVSNIEHFLEPSDDFLKAIETVQRLKAGDAGAKIPDGGSIVQEADCIDQIRKRRAVQLQGHHHKEGEQPKNGRVLVTLQQQEQFIEIQRAKYLQGEHKGIKLGMIDGVKFPNKVNIGSGFLTNGGSAIIGQLNFRKK